METMSQYSTPEYNGKVVTNVTHRLNFVGKKECIVTIEFEDKTTMVLTSERGIGIDKGMILYERY